MDNPSLAKKKNKVLVPKTEEAKKLYALAQQQIDSKQNLDAPALNDRPLLVTAALSDEHISTTWLLLSNGAEPDVLCPIGKTPLLYAAQVCATKTVGTLLYFNANPNHPSYQKSSDHQTPLHALCAPSKDSFKKHRINARQNAVEWLLAAGANTNAQDIHGATPFFGLVACSKTNKSSVLLPQNKKTLFHTARKNLINAFLACKANQNITDFSNKTLFTQSIYLIDPYLSMYIAYKFPQRREKLRTILLTFLKTSPNKPDAQSLFKSIPADILRYILKFAYP